jgi:hypothetical protein
MEDLRKDKQNTDKKNKIFKLRLILFFRKYKYRILILFILATIIIFPEACGQFIGQFITDFLGNIIKYIQL